MHLLSKQKCEFSIESTTLPKFSRLPSRETNQTIVFPDMHGNTMMMISLLMSTGVANFTVNEWHEIHQIIPVKEALDLILRNCPPRTCNVDEAKLISIAAIEKYFLSEHIRSPKDQPRFVEIICSAVKRAREATPTLPTPTLIYVGDTLADRGGDDRWNYLLRAALLKAGVNIRETISNHNCRALSDARRYIFGDPKEKPNEEIGGRQCISAIPLLVSLTNLTEGPDIKTFQTKIFEPYCDTYTLVIYDPKNRLTISHAPIFKTEAESDEERLCQVLASLSTEILGVLNYHNSPQNTHRKLWLTHASIIKEVKLKCKGLDFESLCNRELLAEWSESLNLAFQDMLKLGLVDPHSHEYKKFFSLSRGIASTPTKNTLTQSAFGKITWARRPNSSTPEVSQALDRGTHGHVGPYTNLKGNLDDNAGKGFDCRYKYGNTKCIAQGQLNTAPMMRFAKEKKAGFHKHVSRDQSAQPALGAIERFSKLPTTERYHGLSACFSPDIPSHAAPKRRRDTACLSVNPDASTRKELNPDRKRSKMEGTFTPPASALITQPAPIARPKAAKGNTQNPLRLKPEKNRENEITQYAGIGTPSIFAVAVAATIMVGAISDTPFCSPLLVFPAAILALGFALAHLFKKGHTEYNSERMVRV